MRIAFINGDMLLGGRPYDFDRLYQDARGATGSEISLLRYASGMAKRGHECTLYVSDPGAERWGDVRVRPLRLWECEGGAYDAAYAWVEPDHLEKTPRHVARLLNQQLNDWNYCHPGWPRWVDLVTCPSESHRARMSEMAPGVRFEVQPNGCDPSEYDWSLKVPGRVAYASSPDRGLHLVLWAWPHIKRAAPKAELRIYYFAFERWVREAERNVHHQDYRIRDHALRALYCKRALERNAKNLGIRFEGATSREGMAHALSEAQVLAYPCDVHAYTEGFSCATMEGCAAGALPIISDADALKEIYGDCCPMIPSPAREHVGQWLALVQRALTDEDWRVEQAEKCHVLAQRHSWDYLCEGLERRLEAEVARKRSSGEVSSGRIELSAVQPSKPKIYLTLTAEAASGQVIDLERLGDDSYGGGGRAGFLGLVDALGKVGRWDVHAFSTFPRRLERDGATYHPLTGFGGHSKPAALVTYHDNTPLWDARGILRVSSNHCYQPYPNPDFDWADVATAPSDQAARAMREFYAPKLPWYTLPNGVKPIDGSWRPVRGRVIHHASPSRGLHLLLKVWPEIRRRVPYAELRLVGPIRRWAHEDYADFKQLPGEQARRAAAVKLGIEECKKAGGIQVLDVLPRSRLEQELREAACFAFPCSTISPCETFSVSVMECCALGVPVILSPADALEGVYRGHVQMVPAPAEEHLAEFTDAVVAVLTDPDLVSSLSRKGKELSSRYTFERQARVLDGILCRHLGVKRDEPLPEETPRVISTHSVVSKWQDKIGNGKTEGEQWTTYL